MKLLIYTLLFFSILACAEKEFDPLDSKKSFGIAKEPYDDENYEIAINRLGEFKARFPYSQHASEAELLIANCHFELGQFTEAALAYEQFVKLHPKHPKVDYALFRVGESYWEDAPEEIDREQDYTKRAVDAWSTLLERVQGGPYAKKARILIKEGERRIAESIAFVAGFYCKQDIYHACAYRYLELADEYPQFLDLRLLAYEKAVVAFREVAKAKQAKPDSDKNIFFKKMTVAEINQRADEIEGMLRKLKRSKR